MPDDDPIVINSPLRERQRKSGKTYHTIDIEAEALIHDLSPKTLGAAVAVAIADALRKRVIEISAAAPAATIKARKVAAKAYADGKAWAKKRYGGGRMGDTPPNQSDRAFNDSGRFAKSIVAQAQDETYVVNVAANRLVPESVGSVERIFARLVDLVPAFGNPQVLAQDETIQAAIADGMANAITKAKASGDELSLARVKAYIGVARAALQAIRAMAA
jgi:hypothetical protein